MSPPRSLPPRRFERRARPALTRLFPLLFRSLPCSPFAFCSPSSTFRRSPSRAHLAVVTQVCACSSCRSSPTWSSRRRTGTPVSSQRLSATATARSSMPPSRLRTRRTRLPTTKRCVLARASSPCRSRAATASPLAGQTLTRTLSLAGPRRLGAPGERHPCAGRADRRADVCVRAGPGWRGAGSLAARRSLSLLHSAASSVSSRVPCLARALAQPARSRARGDGSALVPPTFASSRLLTFDRSPLSHARSLALARQPPPMLNKASSTVLPSLRLAFRPPTSSSPFLRTHAPPAFASQHPGHLSEWEGSHSLPAASTRLFYSSVAPHDDQDRSSPSSTPPGSSSTSSSRSAFKQDDLDASSTLAWVDCGDKAVLGLFGRGHLEIQKGESGASVVLLLLRSPRAFSS